MVFLSLPHQESLRRELYFFNLFRLLQASILVGLTFSPLAVQWVVLRHPLLSRIDALLYLLFAGLIFLTKDHWFKRPYLKVSIALTGDIVANVLAMYASSDLQSGLAMLLMVNIGAGALLLPPRRAGFFAAFAAFTVLLQCIYVNIIEQQERSLLEATLFGLGYFASAALCFVLGRQMRETEALAKQRGLDVVNLAQINELIISRMRTGVMVVDNTEQVHRMNEAAWHLLGAPSPDQRSLSEIAPQLIVKLERWRQEKKGNDEAITLAQGMPQVVPRFTRLSSNDDRFVLIFLDDTSLLSRRAEEMTLSSLGRLSASFAHEIRNPLMAIDYSAQLLTESTSLNSDDRRLVDIINNHCGRVNEIIENILQLSRRERSRPESFDLSSWAENFIADFCAINALGSDRVLAVTHQKPIEALADPKQLQQVVWNLVQNALRYGRQPGESAHVSLIARYDEKHGIPLLEVVDKGPGIAPDIAAHIFEPFFSTHEYGTGLGLYLASQMCEANQATLTYVAGEQRGSCFRITFTRKSAG